MSNNAVQNGVGDQSRRGGRRSEQREKISKTIVCKVYLHPRNAVKQGLAKCDFKSDRFLHDIVDKKEVQGRCMQP